MNRQQRRMAAKNDARARAARLGRKGYDMARTRASRWLAGAFFEAVPVTEERDGETVYGLTGHWRFPPTVMLARQGAAADYAAASPQRWRIEASAIFRAEDGEDYVESVEIETGQTLLLRELTDTWRDMLDQARARGNSRHHSHDVVRAWPLVSANG